MTSNGKPKLAMYWAASCGGCEISVLNLGENILVVDEVFDIVFFPAIADFKYDDLRSYPDGYISVAPPYVDVVDVVDDVVDEVDEVVATVDDGGIVGLVVVVSSAPDEQAASTSANTARAARPRRYLMGTSLPPMPSRSIDRTRRPPTRAHPAPGPAGSGVACCVHG